MFLQHHVERTELLIILILTSSRVFGRTIAQDGIVGILTVRRDWLLLLSRAGVDTRRQFEKALGRDLACGVLVGIFAARNTEWVNERLVF